MFRRVGNVRRNLGLRGLSARVGGVGPRLHRHEVDHAAKRLLFADRELNRDDRAPEHAAQRLHGSLEARTLAIEPVEDDDSRYAELLGRRPHLFGRNLRARNGIDHDERRVCNPKRRARVAQEIGDPRSVDDVDLGLVPLGAGEAGCEGVLAGNRFFVVIRHRGAVVHPSQPVDGSGIEQQRRQQLGLARPAVADERDISEALGVIDLHRQDLRRKLPAASFQLPASTFSVYYSPVWRFPLLLDAGDQAAEHTSDVFKRCREPGMLDRGHEPEVPGKKEIILNFVEGPQGVKQESSEVRIRASTCPFGDVRRYRYRCS